MSSENLPDASRASFENLKKLNQHGAEYWTARELQSLLGYKQWRGFEKAILKAISSCKESGNDPVYHFARARKMIELGKGGMREVTDYDLSRFACYLVAQNGDPRIPEIAQAQKYFAIQTRRQELSDAQAADLERLEMRKQTSEEFKALSGAAREAGVQDKMFGIFHDAGYKGLYGGLGSQDIKARKKIPPKDQLMDRMGTTELAANQFRMTQTRDKLAREGVRDQQRAIQAHNQVGKEVRDAIRRIGGTLPENLPPAEHISQVAKRLADSRPKLQLDNKKPRVWRGRKNSGGTGFPGLCLTRLTDACTAWKSCATKTQLYARAGWLVRAGAVKPLHRPVRPTARALRTCRAALAPVAGAGFRNASSSDRSFMLGQLPALH